LPTQYGVVGYHEGLNCGTFDNDSMRYRTEKRIDEFSKLEEIEKADFDGVEPLRGDATPQVGIFTDN